MDAYERLTRLREQNLDFEISVIHERGALRVEAIKNGMKFYLGVYSGKTPLELRMSNLRRAFEEYDADVDYSDYEPDFFGFRDYCHCLQEYDEKKRRQFQKKQELEHECEKVEEMIADGKDAFETITQMYNECRHVDEFETVRYIVRHAKLSASVQKKLAFWNNNLFLHDIANRPKGMLDRELMEKMSLIREIEYIMIEREDLTEQACYNIDYNQCLYNCRVDPRFIEYKLTAGEEGVIYPSFQAFRDSNKR